MRRSEMYGRLGQGEGAAARLLPEAGCRRCGMRFRDAPMPPRRGSPAADIGGVELLRCPDCGRRFWADPHGPGGRCAVGLPAEARP